MSSLESRVKGGSLWMRQWGINMVIHSNICWTDLRAPATAINPPGQVSDPDWDTSKLGWLFDSSSTESLHIIVQLPHEWSEGSTLKPHIHWEKTTSAPGNVLWKISYQWSVHTAARTDAAVLSATTPIVNSDTADTHMITSLGDISGAGYPISAMLLITLSREGGDASDTYGADARLLEFDLHYQKDAGGSLAEYIK